MVEAAFVAEAAAWGAVLAEAALAVALQEAALAAVPGAPEEAALGAA